MLPEITRRYLEPHRHYHGLEHPVRMLREAANRKLKLTDEQVWAIWLHDLVYEPGADDNEERSAELAVEWLRNTPWFCGLPLIERIILDTKDHVPHHERSALVIDLDLLGFADKWLEYRATTDSIRREFKHLNDQEWLEGRIAFLGKMKMRDPFFLTEPFGALHIYAIRNIRRELLLLQEELAHA